MSRPVQLLWGLVVIGVLLRTYVAFKTFGTEFDIESYRMVGEALRDGDPLSAYEQIKQGDISRWPYPPGYWPVISLALALDSASVPFHGLIQLVPIACDVGITWLVWHYLGRRGASDRTRLVGAGLVAVGPAFAYVSGYHGHFDSVAILPAVAALMVWEQDRHRRALIAGLLIGVGASMKTVPILMLIALLPTMRSPREGVTLVAAAVAVPVAVLLPFFLSAPDALAPALKYNGVPGIGGLSLVIQPELAEGFITRRFDVAASEATLKLVDYGTVLMGAALLVIGVWMVRKRTEPVIAACVVWLTVYVLGSAFAFQFAVWGLPFFIMAGFIWQAAVFEAALVPAQILISQAPFEPYGYTLAYTAIMLAIWLVTLVALILLARAVAGRGPPAVAL